MIYYFLFIPLDAKSIINDIKNPFSSDPFDLIMNLLICDNSAALKSYKIPPIGFQENKEYISKQKVLQAVNPINKEIRQLDNILSDNYYDSIVNECIVDASNELIEKER